MVRRSAALAAFATLTAALLVTGACEPGPEEEARPGGGGESAAPAATRTTADTAGRADAEERIAAWERGRPDEPLYASVAFDRPRSDSAVAVVLARHGVEPYRAFVTAAGVVTSSRVPPDEASIRFLHTLRNRVRTGLETSLCAQPARASALLELGAPDPERARALVRNVERHRAAVERLRKADARYVYGVEVVGWPDEIRSLLTNPDVGAVEPAAREAAPQPPSGSATGPAEERTSEEALEELRRLAQGIDGCGPHPPPAARDGALSGR